MSTAPAKRDLVIAISAGGNLTSSPRIAGAARHGGGWGVFDLASGDGRVLESLEQAVSWSSGPIGVRVPAGCGATIADVERAGGGNVDLVVLPMDTAWELSEAAGRFRVLAEVTSADEAHQAAESGALGLIARGMESGGRVSELSTFILLQQLLADDELRLPVWAAGGIGPHTAVACLIGGAAGVVLDSQLALMPEADLPDDVTAIIRRMDGSEVVADGQYRGLPRGGAGDAAAELLPIGQDGWLANVFARRWRNTAAAVRAIRETMLGAATDQAASELLAPGAPLAQALGVRVPVAQGPMTRVSDGPGFAAAIADGGGLPFIALAMASAKQTRQMLRSTAEELGDRPWGVGVLGFMPEELRTAQLDVIREVKPAYAIIAGGRPPQAKALEREGIAAFLHVPSPGLLRQFLQSGARRFIFEGNECGGHIGPHASFPLWEAQLQVLDEYLKGQDAKIAKEIQVFFAGGIHDARSAAMVAAMAASVAHRGVRVGVLMGTAYLFTQEAIANGAILPLFQRKMLDATGTSLLQTAPGHVTRCVHSEFVDDFHTLRAELAEAGVDDRQIWEQLEALNVGRLRIASKGIRRDGDALVEVDEETQESDGMFMAGQVAVLRGEPTTVAALHDEVSVAAAALHADRVDALSSWLRPAETHAEPPAPLDIAIVGMSCMLPGSPDLASYWRTVLSGADVITEVPADRWDVDLYYAPEVPPGKTGRISVSKWGGFLAPVPFDAIGYGIPPSTLGSIEPTQLLALEVANRALIDAGYPYDAPEADHNHTGVVFGAEAGSDMANAQSLRTGLPAYLGELPDELEDLLPTVTEDSFPGILANVIAGRVANRLNLGGPNYTIDAACASSLAALDAACKELLAGDSDMMICGGADLHNGINDYLMFTSAHAISPTGRSRTFDSTGDGIALGEGVAAIVLKRLADAERDGDRIYAVIKGLGAASDGRALGLTAPRPEGQRRALDRAYHRAGISPSQVGLVEAHGTGTVVGDRTELETLTKLFTEAGAEPGSCVLGSVKSQIGHTKCAAGLAGLIKTALALHTGVKPPTINLSRPNPAWNPQRSPFVFHTEARPWSAPPSERIAGVSAFGFGGTNFHTVLTAYAKAPAPRHTASQWPAELFCFRGADRASAHRGVRKLLETLAASDGRERPGRLREVAAELARNSDPRSGPVRVAVVAQDLDDLGRLLTRALSGEHDPAHGLVQPEDPPAPADGARPGPDGKVAFLFPGQGSQRPGALADLFVAFPEVHRYLHLGREWADLMFPPTAFDDEERKAQEARVRDTRVAQPALGIGGLAVDHLLRRLNIRPDMAGGHSYGELVALSTTGAFDSRTLLRLSKERAAAILAAAGDDPGTMAAVKGTAERVREVLAEANLADQVVLANHNSPDQIVISGTTPAVGTAVTALKQAGLSARALSVACAFHSPVVAGGVDRFAEVLANENIAAPRIPVWSNRTAQPYQSDEAQVRADLAGQIGAPVRFVEQIESMYAAGARVFVEVGPGRVLTNLVGAVLGDRAHRAIACDGRRGDGLRGFLIAVAELACAGVPVQPGWLFHGRDASTAAKGNGRPVWTVDGQLVRDSNGECVPGGMKPARRIKESWMTSSNGVGSNGRDAREEVLSEFLRTTRELIASQRDVMLSYFGGGGAGRMVWQPAEAYPPVMGQPALSPVPMNAMTTTPDAAMPAAVPEYAMVSNGANGAALASNGNGGQLTEVMEQPPASAPAPATGPTIQDFQQAILDVISERTGYPVDLIEFDLDLEADLSIDSIKRAEVAGEVAVRLQLSVDGDESELEGLVKARTVRAMVEWLGNRSPQAGQAVDAGAATVALSETPAPEAAVLAAEPVSANGSTLTNGSSGNGANGAGAAGAEPVAPLAIAPTRMVTKSVPLPEAVREPVSVLSGATFLITGDTPVAATLSAMLAEHGATTRTGVLDQEQPADVTGIDGLIMLDGLAEGAPLLPEAFPTIKRALAVGPRWLLAAADRTGERRTDGMRGLARTIGREYPHLVARYLEVETASADEVARRVLDELLIPAAAPVLSHVGAARHVPDLVPEGLGALADRGAGPAGAGAAEAQAIGLDSDSVVVLVGGARGITPWFARTLASASRCRIELIGRTPLPEQAEEADVAAATDAAALRAVLARRGMRSPAEIERTVRSILAGREVNATLNELRERGSEVRYHTLDVRDEDATHQLLKSIYGDYRRIDGLVYAAGTIEDKLLAEKDPGSFNRVFGTKVDGARAMLESLEEMTNAPKFVTLFGSIAAAYGNRGQCDYAAANDALDSMGSRWARRTGNRALTVHWGPWAPAAGHTGMVTDELSREYARRGIGLIDPEEGALCLLRELAWGDPALTSVVYTASGW